MTNERDGITYQTAWQSADLALQQGVIDFWIEHNVLPGSISPQDRIRELLGVAMDETDGIVSIATAELKEIADIGEIFFCYRNFVSPAVRKREIGTQLLLQTFLAMQAGNRQLSPPAPVGFYMEIENRQLMQYQNDAIWFDTRFLYIGTTAEGWHRRLRYFSHATFSRLSRANS